MNASVRCARRTESAKTSWTLFFVFLNARSGLLDADLTVVCSLFLASPSPRPHSVPGIIFALLLDPTGALFFPRFDWTSMHSTEKRDLSLHLELQKQVLEAITETLSSKKPFLSGRPGLLKHQNSGRAFYTAHKSNQSKQQKNERAGS